MPLPFSWNNAFDLLASAITSFQSRCDCIFICRITAVQFAIIRCCHFAIFAAVYATNWRGNASLLANHNTALDDERSVIEFTLSHWKLFGCLTFIFVFMSAMDRCVYFAFNFVPT